MGARPMGITALPQPFQVAATPYLIYEMVVCVYVIARGWPVHVRPAVVGTAFLAAAHWVSRPLMQCAHSGPRPATYSLKERTRAHMHVQSRTLSTLSLFHTRTCTCSHALTYSLSHTYTHGRAHTHTVDLLMVFILAWNTGPWPSGPSLKTPSWGEVG